MRYGAGKLGATGTGYRPPQQVRGGSAEHAERLAALRAEIAAGMKQARDGDLIPGDDVFAMSFDPSDRFDASVSRR
jgi:hypothetical protein